jgi:hypothetical protein
MKREKKEIGLELLQSPLKVLEIPVVSFPPYAPYKEKRHHLLDDCTP